VREVKNMIRGAGVSVVKSVREVREDRVMAVFGNDAEKERVRENLQSTRAGALTLNLK